MPQKINGNSESCFVQRCIIVNHQVEPELLAAVLDQGCANQASTMRAHKIDDLGSCVYSCSDKIAFVFTVFVINNNNKLAIFYIFYSTFDRIEHFRIFVQVSKKSAASVGANLYCSGDAALQ